MKRYGYAALLVSLAFVAKLQARDFIIANFQDGNEGFSGSLVQDTAKLHEGDPSGRIDFDFSKDGGTSIDSGKTLDIPDQIKSLDILVAGNNVRDVVIRLIDSIGQPHSIMVSVAAGWSKVSLPVVESRPWWSDGKDLTIHWPVKQIVITVRRMDVTNASSAGQVWIGKITAKVDDKSMAGG